MHGETTGPLEIQDPGEGQLWGFGGTGSMHRGDSWDPLEIRGPQGTCSTHRGIAAVPKGVPRRQACPGDPPRWRMPGGQAGVAGRRGRARPEECGRPGSPGTAAAPSAPARGRGAGCGKAAGVRLGNRPPPHHAPAAAPTAPPARRVYFFPQFSLGLGQKMGLCTQTRSQSRAPGDVGPPPAQHPQPGQEGHGQPQAPVCTPGGAKTSWVPKKCGCHGGC